VPKKVALIGHCGPDSSYLRMTISKAAKDVMILSADDDAELSDVLGQGPDLLLFNRQLGYGFSETQGVKVIAKLRGKLPIKMMLISNHLDAQEAAVTAGALPGFGKREIGTPKVLELLREALKD
jgi:two-component system chemotaxis response regulator CheY